MEVPDGALSTGATFKLTHLSAADLEQQFPGQKPNLGTDENGAAVGHLASGIRVDLVGQQLFDKEIDLVFPIPVDAPADARYQVYRRLQGPNGRYLFEILDIASIGCPLDKPTCDVSEKRVRTNSCPFSGFINSYTAFDVENQPLLGSGNDIFLSWHTEFDNGGDKIGVITGRVIQPITSSAGTRFDGVAGALVSGVDAAGNPFYEDLNTPGRTVTISQLWQEGQPERGRYTLLDPSFAGGAVTMKATKGDKSGSGIGFEIPVSTCSAIAGFKNKVQVNITFPPENEPPPPPQIGIEVRNAADNKLVGGLVPEGTRLLVRFLTPATVTSAQINGIEYTVEVETAGASAKINGDFTPLQPGAYSIEVIGLSAETGAVVRASRTLRAVAAGGGVDTLPGVEPRVIEFGPTQGSTGVPVSAFVEVKFSEPVRRILDAATPYVNVRIEELDPNGSSIGPIPITVSGVTPQPVTVIADLLNGSQAVTALTLIPQAPLRFNTTYKVTLLDGIEDLDETPQGAPSPRHLGEFSWTFETFGPSEIGMSGDQTGSPNIATAGDRVFLARTNYFINGNVLSFTADPAQPEMVGQSGVFAPRPYDIAAQGDETQKTVAVGVGSTYLSKPSSILIYDATNDSDIKLVGAATLTQSAQEGFIRRIAIKGDFVYSATMKKGIQVVDIAQAKAAIATMPAYQVATSLNTDGQGVGGEAVVQTIPIPTISPDRHYLLYDMAVEDLGGRRLAAVTGQFPLMIADVNTGQTLFPQSFPGTLTNASVTFGYAVALGRVSNRDLAVLVDEDQLHAIDLTNPASPRVLGSVGYANVTTGYGPVSVILKGDQALIGLQKPDGSSGITIVIGLEDPTAPRIAGQILNVGGRLALTADGLLVSTASLPFGGGAALGGVHTATLGQLAVIMPVAPTMARPVDVALLTGNDETIDAVQLDIRTFPKQPQSPVTVQLFANNLAVGAPVSYDVPPTGRVAVELPRGLSKAMTQSLKAQASFTQDGVLFQSVLRLIPFNTPVLTVDSNNDTFVDKRDDEKIKADSTAKFVFWEGDTRLEPQDAIVDYATVRVTLPYALPADRNLALVMDSGASGTSWELRRKVADGSVCEGDNPQQGTTPGETGKAHLCKESAFEAQKALLVAAEQPTRGVADSILIPSSLLKPGVNEYLVRCNAKQDGSRACGGDKIYVVASDPVGNPTSYEFLASRQVEIRPFEELTAMATLRRGTIPSSDPTSQIYQVDSTYNDEPGWKKAIEDLPADAEQVTLFVHGFNVTHEQFTKSYEYIDCAPFGIGCREIESHRKFAPPWFAQWAKRSYWAGNPTLAAQKGYVVGVSWPGDIPGFPDAAFYLPEDQFNAFQAGIPAGKLISTLRTRLGPSKKLAIFAHSLGNIVVNNALKEVVATGAVSPVNYVMHDAAVAAEAFEKEFNAAEETSPSPVLNPVLLAHVRTLGFPDPLGQDPLLKQADGLFIKLEQEIAGLDASNCVQIVEGQVPPEACLYRAAYLSGREAVADSLDPLAGATDDPLSTPFFTKRWRKWRRTGDDAGFVPGAWTRFFSANVADPTIRVFNTFNPADYALAKWTDGEAGAKPYGTVLKNGIAVFGPGQGEDPPGEQRWWTLQLSGRPNHWASVIESQGQQDSIWGSQMPVDVDTIDEIVPTREQRTREWAELSMWFPAVSAPVGAVVSPALASQDPPTGAAFQRLQFGASDVRGRNVSFGAFGGSGKLAGAGTLSHSYLYIFKLAEVWRGYRSLAALFGQ
ncbi:MAG: Ig-like domain-containing protein [Anaerolineaceae bacterium]